MNIKIRQAEKADFDKIYELVKVSFETAQKSDGNEQNFVNELRKSNRYISHLEFVAEQNNELIGHIMLSNQVVWLEDEKLEALLLAPICVKMEKRSEKIGAKLIEKSFETAKGMGYTAVFLVGNPDYYCRFGFENVTKYGIRNDSKIPDEYVLGCELVKGTLQNKKGFIKII